MAFVSRQASSTRAERLESALARAPQTTRSPIPTSLMGVNPVVVPLTEIIKQLPPDYLVDHITPKQTLVQVVPDLSRRGISMGEVHFRLASIREAAPHLFQESLRLGGHETIQIAEKHVFLGVPSAATQSQTSVTFDSTISFDNPMNLSQPSGNESTRIPGVRPLSGPENAGQGAGSGLFKPDEAPTVKVYPPANQSPAIRPVKPTLPPSRSNSAEPVLSGQADGEFEPSVSINLKSLLKGIPVSKLGFNPDQIPANVATQLPVSLVKPMMASGHVEVSLGDIIGGCLDRYRPAFAKADTNERINLPMQELQNQIPQQGSAGQPQESPFAPAAGAHSPGHAPENPFQAAPAKGGVQASPFASGGIPTPESPFQSPFGQSVAAKSEASPFATASPAPASPFAATAEANPFGRPVDQPSHNGVQETPSPFAAPSAQQASPFAPAQAEATEPNPFSSPAAEVSPFANANPSPFGAAHAEASPFGAAAPAEAASPFGAAPAASPFGSAPAASPFGAAPAASPFGAATAASPFGTAPAASPFGTAPAASPFGTAPAASPFGTAPAASPFGAASAEAPPTGATMPAEPSPFGTVSPFGTPEAASPFGAAPPLAEASPLEAIDADEAPSPFGTASQNGASAVSTEASPFGAPAESHAIASPFGTAPEPKAQAEASPFGTPQTEKVAASPFGVTPAEPATSAASFQETAAPVTPSFPFGTPSTATMPEEPKAPESTPREAVTPPAQEAPPKAAPFPGASAEPVGAGSPPASASLPATQRTAPAQQGRGFDFGFQDDPNQLALRAIFAVDSTLNLEEVLDRTTNLSGINACVLIEKKTGATKIGRSSDDSRAKSFEEQAKQAYNKVISLAEDLQITDAETFTLRTAQGAMSFFNSPNACLAVLHRDPEFPAGVREKLILITRDLSTMV